MILRQEIQRVGQVVTLKLLWKKGSVALRAASCSHTLNTTFVQGIFIPKVPSSVFHPILTTAL